ncbi:MAG: PAS domain S-box protein [Methylobacterium frigidaeris]
MQTDPSSPVFDPARLTALEAHSILDTLPEQGFDDIVRLATRLCAVPVALVSLVAADRQWFKARVGFPHCETDLDRSVCKFALPEPDLLIIPDLAADPRTATNPLVTDDPHIRFYAGAPLRTPEGHVLGSLCVIDTVPRPAGLTPEQGDDLRALARQVTDLLSMRRAVAHRDAVLNLQRDKLRQARHLDILSKVSEALLGADDPAAVLDPILAEGAGPLGFDRSYTYDLWPDGGDLRLTHALNATQEVQDFLRRLPHGAPLCGIVAERRQPLVLTGLQRSDETAYRNARAIGLDAYAGFPLMSRGELRGVISFASTLQPAFDDETLTFFATVARLMSAVYERLDGKRALREGEDRLRLVIESAKDHAILTTDPEGTLTSWSAGAEGVFGWSADEVVGRPVHVIYTPADRAAGIPERELSKARGDGCANDERWHLTKSGALAFMNGSVHPLPRDVHGRERGFIKVARDETGRRRMEDALRESEARFRTILDTVEAAFAIVEVKFDGDDRPVDYRFVEANPAFERQAGVDLRGKWVTEFAPDLERFWFETYGRVASTGESANFESYAEAFGRWFDVRAVRVGRPEERRIAILFNDVTERRVAQKALHESEGRFRALVTAGEQVVYRMSPDWQEMHALDGAGFLADTDAPSERWLDLYLDQADRPGVLAAIEDAVRRRDVFELEHRVRRADGTSGWTLSRAVPILDERGGIVEWFGAARDVSDRHAAQEALAASEAHWRGLFERLSEGFIVGEVVRDAEGAIRDWRYVDVNAAWGELVSIDVATVVGRTICEVFPGIEDAWVREFADVVETGEPIGFTRQVGTLARWYEGRAFPLGNEQFGVIFLEITDRVQAEARRAALLALGDRLRDMTSVEEMTLAACGILGETLGAMLVGYGDVDPQRETITVERDWTTGGAETLAGTLSFRDYGSYIEDLKRGETVVVTDCRSDPRTRSHAAALEARSARAFVNTPVFERGAFVAMLFVCTGQARDWSKPELAFIHDVGSRLRLAVSRLRAEERQDLLNHELSHRLKNTLAVVQSIAGQTLRPVAERGPVEAFEQRILALARAHDVLLQDAWAPASLLTVVASVLGPHAAMDRFVLSGAEIALAPSAVLSLSLLLHELATNAAKYGALSVEGGHVDLSWAVLDGDEKVLELGWRECGGPPAVEPARRGFGTRLIRNGLVGTRDVRLDYTSEGFTASFRAPLAQVQAS